MDTTQLRLAAARHSLGLATGEELHKVADNLLTRGVYSYSLGELFCVARPTLREVAPLFETALRELGVPLPAPELAIRTLVARDLEDIAEGRGDPRGAVRRLAGELSGLVGWRILEDCPGRDELVALSLDYDDVSEMVELGYVARAEGERRLVEMEQGLAQFAVRWIREHHPSRIDRSWLAWSGGVVAGLAEAIAGEGAWDRLPILADALEEAGCDDPYLLGHLRGAGSHVRGCFVLALLLGGGWRP